MRAIKKTRRQYLRETRKIPSDDDLKTLFFDWGLRYKDIAKIYDCSSQLVDSNFRRMGFRKGHWKLPRDDDSIKKILADESRSMSQKASDLGVSKSSLFYHRKRLEEEIEMNFNNGQHDERIKHMRLERRMTIWKIARDLKVSTEFIKFRFKVLGIPEKFVQQQIVKDPKALRGAIANTNLTYKEIADTFGIKRAIVQHYALKWGFRRMQTPVPINDDILIEKYCKEFWSPYRIWKELGYNRRNAINRLKELGLFREGEEFWKAKEEWRSRNRGGPHRMQGGYPLIRVPKGHATRMTKRARDNGIQFAHVIEMEKKLGRPMKPNEMIHHIDCDKANFNIDNLCLCKSNSQHMNIHATLEYVIGQLYSADLVGFRPDCGYYLKKIPKEEDMVELVEPPPASEPII